MQSSLPAGWLASTGRELNPLDRYKRFQITLSSPFSGFILAQGKFHDAPSMIFFGDANSAINRESITDFRCCEKRPAVAVHVYPALPNKSGNRATFIAIRRASSAVSTFACRASACE
jgi:hypothetical protein